jgi:glycosyltransferase involved in cell wall biosynthesis
LALLDDNQPNTVDYYRIIQAYDVLIDKGYPLAYIPYGMARRMAQLGQLQPENFDIFVMCRASVGQVDKRLIDFMRIIHESGRKLIYETDDDYTNEHRRTTEGDAITVAQACDACTTTTPYLAKVLKQHNPHVYVLPNAINFDIWGKVERHEEETITIGLAGTGTHFEDYKLVKDALFKLAETHGNRVRFLLLGYKPYYLEDLPNMEFIEFRPYADYASTLGQVDIGLCPLVPDDPFNLAKSAIKALEYMAAGAAVIAQNMPVYRRVVAHRGNGLLADEDWYEKVVLLVEDAQLRRRLSRRGRAWVRKHRNIHALARKWWRAYEEVYHL